MRAFRFRSVLIIVSLLIFRTAIAQEITATPDHAGGIYRVGEAITWRVEVRGPGAEGVSEAKFTIKGNGLKPLADGLVTLSGGVGSFGSRAAVPTILLAEVKATVGGKEIGALAGAAVAPERIGPTAPRPADFDAFWRGKIAELKRTPAAPVLAPAESGNPAVDYWKIEMANIRGSRIHGQLARPHEPGKRPALLIVQWAGVYPLARDWAVGRAAQGWLTLNIMAHDLPFDRPQAYYDELMRTTLSNYPAIGNDSRETAYFLRMYLSCYRAAEYLATRPDWDGRTLVVMGASQGGLQTIVTAAIHPKITAAIADVPAGCDLDGPSAERAPGWPQWCWQTQGKDAAKVREAGRYFDVVNFAPRVKQPVMVGLGLIDTTCPASGVYAMLNQLRGPKEIVLMADMGHGGWHRAQQERAEAWLTALREGRGAPLPGR